MNKNWYFAFALGACVLAAGCAHSGATAKTPMASATAAPSGEKFEQDRKVILSMAGEYSVNFDFHETLRFDPAAAVSEPDVTDAKELVVLVEDKGNFISLQHLLMVGGNQVVKHWRQDWRYEDNVIHDFKGHLTWEPRTLTPEETKGTWTQTVYQVDDSPRYEGYGKWVHIADYSYWDSNETWRPLPRREYTKRDDYDVLVGRNRHAVTKDGWTHEQDNYKLRLRDGKKEVIARETGVNTYEHSKDYDFAAAKEYWQKTGPFWSDVRKAWDDQYATMKTFHLIGDDNKDSLWRLVSAEADEFAKSGKAPEGGVAKTIEARLRPGLREN
ncbi:MAG: hypothetical protein IT366_20185 [Candidatus Hydrogenedentes bacterium]|nr:hypothetical protein [Candidatus Hydrogenedentota bacterium]